MTITVVDQSRPLIVYEFFGSLMLLVVFIRLTRHIVMELEMAAPWIVDVVLDVGVEFHKFLLFFQFAPALFTNDAIISSSPCARE